MIKKINFVQLKLDFNTNFRIKLRGKFRAEKYENEVEYGRFSLIFNVYLNYVINKVKKYFINIEKDIEEELL